MRGLRNFLKCQRWVFGLPVLLKPRPSHFIFDLDRTLWDFTVEDSPSIMTKDIENYIQKDRNKILRTIQDEGHIISIASRSKAQE